MVGAADCGAERAGRDDSGLAVCLCARSPRKMPHFAQMERGAGESGGESALYFGYEFRCECG
jgi:hypothetical protein